MAGAFYLLKEGTGDTLESSRLWWQLLCPSSTALIRAPVPPGLSPQLAGRVTRQVSGPGRGRHYGLSSGELVSTGREEEEGGEVGREGAGDLKRIRLAQDALCANPVRHPVTITAVVNGQILICKW